MDDRVDRAGEAADTEAGRFAPAESAEAPPGRLSDLAAGIAARDIFLAGAAHDLRNPMTPILGQVQRLGRMLDAREPERDRMRHSLRRLEALVQLYIMRATTLLDVASLTGGRFHLRPARCNVADVVHGALEMHHRMAHLARARIRVEAPEVLTAEIDPVVLAQVLNNFLLDVVVFSAGCELRIVLDGDADNFELALGGACVVVPDDIAIRLQQPFEPAFSDPARVSFDAGLWVAGQLIRMMSGTVSVDRALSGVNVSIRFPRFPSHVGEVASASQNHGP